MEPGERVDDRLDLLLAESLVLVDLHALAGEVLHNQQEVCGVGGLLSGVDPWGTHRKVRRDLAIELDLAVIHPDTIQHRAAIAFDWHLDQHRVGCAGRAVEREPEKSARECCSDADAFAADHPHRRAQRLAGPRVIEAVGRLWKLPHTHRTRTDRSVRPYPTRPSQLNLVIASESRWWQPSPRAAPRTISPGPATVKAPTSPIVAANSIVSSPISKVSV